MRSWRSFAVAVAVLAASAARAGGNDVELWRLGNPNPITVCTLCDGSSGDSVPVAGDLQAQVRFARMSSTLGLALIPAFHEQARTTGQAGFELGFSTQTSFIALGNDEWASERTQALGDAPKVLVLPTVSVRKGLGGGFELGAAVSHVYDSNILGLSAELRWAVLEGLDAPDISVRAYGTRAIGTRDLDLVAAGADLMVSGSFGVGGTIKLQPYAQGGLALVNATSGIVDFRPQTEDTARPGANPLGDDEVFRTVSMLDNRYGRGAIGCRMVAGAVVLGLEGGVALGRNAIQSDAITGQDVPRQFTRVWNASARLGLTF
jgi:hypothetical protein